jgi:multidrug efflux pump subunit AcrA (membrane-fusion protein)
MILKLHKRKGESVQLGDLIATLDTQPTDHKERQAIGVIKDLTNSNKELELALSARQRQINAIDSQYQNYKNLAAQGFTSKNFLSTIEVQLANAQSEALELKSQITANNLKIRELNESVSRLITSPTSGNISDLISKKPGDRVLIGELIVEIQPDDPKIYLKIQISPKDLPYIKVGQTVKVLFPTILGPLSSSPQIGHLDHLNTELQSDEPNAPYLQGKVSLDLSQLQYNKDLIKIGTPISAMVTLGEQSLLNYLMAPLKERVARGLR